MGNFEKLSVLVIVVIIVMILVVALYTWTDNPQSGTPVAENPARVTTPFVDPIPPGLAPVNVLPPAVVPPTTRVGAATPPAVGKDGKPLAGMPAPDDGLIPHDPTAPAVPAPGTDEAKPEVKKHTVAKGDTLGGISTKYYGSSRHISDIQKANPDVNAMALRIGTVLTIPAISEVKKTEAKDAAVAVKEAVNHTSDEVKKVADLKPGALYTVKKGDKLPEIARRTYGAIDRWPDVWLENYDKIEDPDTLIPGTRLKLPK